MMTWVVLTNLMSNNFFGTYSSLLNARKAFENFFKNETNFILEDVGDYKYVIHNLITGEQYGAEIYYDEIDADVPD